MSFESETDKKILSLALRIEKLEEIYPQIYRTLIGLQMMADSNTDAANEVVKLMSNIKLRLESIEKFMVGIN